MCHRARTASRKPIRIITSSWGSQPPTENYNTLEPPPGAPASFGLNAAFRYLSTPEGVADANGNTSHWLNGAIAAARTGTIMQFTAGNSGYANPTARGAAPYYLPDLEGSYYTTSGINPGIGRTFNPDAFFLNVTFPTAGQYWVQTLIDSNLYEEQMLTISDVTEQQMLGASEAVN